MGDARLQINKPLLGADMTRKVSIFEAMLGPEKSQEFEREKIIRQKLKDYEEQEQFARDNLESLRFQVQDFSISNYERGGISHSFNASIRARIIDPLGILKLLNCEVFAGLSSDDNADQYGKKQYDKSYSIALHHSFSESEIIEESNKSVTLFYDVSFCHLSFVVSYNRSYSNGKRVVLLEQVTDVSDVFFHTVNHDPTSPTPKKDPLQDIKDKLKARK